MNVCNETIINSKTIINTNNRKKLIVEYDDTDETKTDTNKSTSENIIARNVNVTIYRYTFTETFTDELFKFSKIHQYDERKAFKEAWNIWMEDNDYIVNEEYRRLKEIGYSGDIFDKMFKSARYYFRKKSTEKKESSIRRRYVGSQKCLLDAMDEYINCNIKSGHLKPSEGFDEFCKQNIQLLKEEINVLKNNGLTDSNEIKGKIKKTFKNRYFVAIGK